MATVREQLSAAGVSEASLAILDSQELLDEGALRLVTADQLTAVKLPLGAALKVKGVFPSAEAASAVAAQVVPPPQPSAAGPTTLVVKKEKVTDASVLAELATGSPDGVEAARKRFKDRTIFVTKKDGSLDAEATLGYLAWAGRTGQTAPRFKNGEGAFVQLVDLAALLNTRIDLNPFTGQVLVPGDPFEALSPRQRLLVAFALVTRAISRDINMDLVIEQATRSPLSGTWAQVETDLETAERKKDESVRRAESLLSRSVEPHREPVSEPRQTSPRRPSAFA